MAGVSLARKKINGISYWYARRCQRVDGKPKIVWQKYLGRADRIVEAVECLSDPPPPKECVVYEFGAVAALHYMAEKLDLLNTINRHVPKRRQGITVGHYLLIATISRSLSSRSKRATGPWYANTVLSAIYPHIQPKHLTSQRFWDYMDYVPLEAIPAIEEDITKRILNLYNLDLRCLLYDTTNYFTFIDTFNERCKIAKRGKNKQKRMDLRQVSLALLVTLDSRVPLFHKTYEGNINDITSFKSVVDSLVKRLRALRENCEDVTFVFDSGNNSKESLHKLDDCECHFVGSLVLSHHKDLYEIDRDLFEPLPGHEGLSTYRTTKTVFGNERTVVITFNEEFFKEQVMTLDRDIAKAQGILEERKQRLEDYAANGHRGGFKPTRASVSGEVDKALSRPHMKKILHVEITETESGVPRLRYELDGEAYSEVLHNLCGKKILFTDNHHWSTREIVEAYHNLYVIEHAIRRTKTTDFVKWSPMYHWTDQKIAVHASYCTLSLTLVSLLHKECRDAGLQISLEQMMDELEAIREVALIYPTQRKRTPKPVLTMSEMNDIQRQLFELFRLEKCCGRYYAPT